MSAQPETTARALLAAGASFIPIKIDGSKAPSLQTWKEYQDRLPTESELMGWFGGGKTRGIAMIMGRVSDNAELIDFDSPALILPYRTAIEAEAPGLLARLVQVETPRAGLHLIYRCSIIEGNQKLAQEEIPATEEDVKNHLARKSRSGSGAMVVIKTTIETRGEGGYAVAVGSPARCHATGKLYKLINGDLSAIPIITPDERDSLLNTARGFSKMPPEQAKPLAAPRKLTGEMRPGDDFNARGDVAALLERHGWVKDHDDEHGSLWRRPGKEAGWSARLFADGHFWPFSTNAAPFEDGHSYDPFAVFAQLEHDGDLSAAAKALAAQHYGDQSRTLERSNMRTQAPKKQEQAVASEPDTPFAFPSEFDPDAPPSDGSWGAVVALNDAICPPFPIDALPLKLMNFADAVAYTTQTPPDLCGSLLLAALACASHGKYALQVKPGWMEWSTVYVVCAAPSGSRKSAVFSHVMRPIIEFEKNERKRMKPIVERNKLQKKMLEARIRDAAGKVNRGSNEERATAEGLLAELTKEYEQIKELELPRILVEDVTTERLATLLGRHNERLSLFSPEGDTFKLMAGMYNLNGKGNLSLYLKSFDGEFCRIDRQDQDRTVILNRPSLAIGLAVQPAVIRAMAETPEFLERGVVQRFLFSLAPDLLGHREVETGDIPTETAEGYHLTLSRLLADEVPTNGQGEAEPNIVKMTEDAQKAVTEFQSETETLLLDKEVPDGLREWRSKAPGKMARLAMLLTLADDADPDATDIPAQPTVGVEAVKRAIQLIRYYGKHCEIAFGVMTADKSFVGARIILEWLMRKPVLEFTKRDCFRSLARQFTSPDAMQPAFKLLYQLGYIRRKESKTRAAGTFQVNPNWLDSIMAVDSCSSSESTS